jgi:hypothetical protein
VEHLLANLYVLRSFSIWKDPAYCTWFGETVTDLCTSNPSEFTPTIRGRHFLELYSSPGPRESTYRHVIVLGDSFRRLSAFLPAEVLATKILNCDPLPPLTSVSQYDEEFFRGTDDLFVSGTQTRREVDMRMLRRLVPDALLRDQMLVMHIPTLL